MTTDQPDDDRGPDDGLPTIERAVEQASRDFAGKHHEQARQKTPSDPWKGPGKVEVGRVINVDGTTHRVHYIDPDGPAWQHNIQTVQVGR